MITYLNIKALKFLLVKNGDNAQLVKKSWEYWEMLKNRTLLKIKI